MWGLIIVLVVMFGGVATHLSHNQQHLKMENKALKERVLILKSDQVPRVKKLNGVVITNLEND